MLNIETERASSYFPYIYLSIMEVNGFWFVELTIQNYILKSVPASLNNTYNATVCVGAAFSV